MCLAVKPDDDRRADDETSDPADEAKSVDVRASLFRVPRLWIRRSRRNETIDVASSSSSDRSLGRNDPSPKRDSGLQVGSRQRSRSVLRGGHYK